MNKKSSIILRKLILSFMMVSFFYLVIGDLILIHQKAIYNYDAYAGQPILKPNKNNKEDYSFIKKLKGNHQFHLLTFVSEIVQPKLAIENCSEVFVVINRPLAPIGIVWKSSLSFRGPPQIS